MLAVPDYIIIGCYLLLIVIIGLIANRRNKSNSIDSYFLGSRKIPWWALAASGMSSNLDVSGTMINTAFVYVMGVSGLYVELRGGVTLALAFLMTFMGKWNRRGEVMTMAEWMKLRFGSTKQGALARIVAAIAMLIFSTANITYFAIGSGKFVAEFLGLGNWLGIRREFWAALIMCALAMVYTVTSGLNGVVWTDVVQSVLIFAAIVYIVVQRFVTVSLPNRFNVSIPTKNASHPYMAVPMTKAKWFDIIPPWSRHYPQQSGYSMYNLFGVCIIFYLVKVVVEGAGGTTQYMAQRYFALQNDKECGTMSLLWIFLLSFRWPFIMAIAMLGVHYGIQHGAPIADPERVLPTVIERMTPVGVKGFLVSGLTAAAMSTFDSTVNAAAAYWVKDIFQGFIRPRASRRTLMIHSRVASIIIVAAALVLTLFLTDINTIWGFINGGIGAGLLVPLVGRWYWWRFNGLGFSLGVGCGMVASLIVKFAAPHLEEYFVFIITSVVSLIAMIVGTVIAPPPPHDVLVKFYAKTRPGGFWGPVRREFDKETLKKIGHENWRDFFATIAAVPFQVFFFLAWMCVVMQTWGAFGALCGILVLLGTFLVLVWMRYLNRSVTVRLGSASLCVLDEPGQGGDGDGTHDEAKPQDGDNLGLLSSEVPHAPPEYQPSPHYDASPLTPARPEGPALSAAATADIEMQRV